MIWVVCVIGVVLVLGPGLDWLVLDRRGGVRFTVQLPDGTSYVGRFGHWLPRVLGTDDTVIAGTPLFRLRWFQDGALASPSPGHLAHAGTHVLQQRRAGIGRPFALLRTLAWWTTHGRAAEAEADAYAEAHRDDPFFTTQWQRLRATVRRT